MNREIGNMFAVKVYQKSERNQAFKDQHKSLKRQGLLELERPSAVSLQALRTLRRKRKTGVTLYRRDAVKEHSKSLIPQRIEAV